MENIIEIQNKAIFEKLSDYLCLTPRAITSDEVAELMCNCNISEEKAYSLLLAANLGMDISQNRADRDLYELYFAPMLKKLTVEKYVNNAYYKNIKIPAAGENGWQFTTKRIAPYELFVYNDIEKLFNGRQIPSVGFFDTEFLYPAVLQDGREWMTVTPNEIETMAYAADGAHGKVLTYGLGLGYFAYMASEKDNVTSVTIIEKDKTVISLFTKYVLPQFNFKDKISVLQKDVFEYAVNEMPEGRYDFVFADIWHDPSDGVEAYNRLKQTEILSPKTVFNNWIAKTLKCYL